MEMDYLWQYYRGMLTAELLGWPDVYRVSALGVAYHERSRTRWVRFNLAEK